MFDTLFSLGASLLYLLTGFLLYRRLMQGVRATERARLVALTVAVGGVLLHALAIHHHLYGPHGIDIGLFGLLSLSTWLLALMLLLATLTRPLENLGILVFPLAAVALLLKLLLPESGHWTAGLSAPLQLHILVSILGYSVLTMAAAQALLMHIQESHLRNRHPGGFIRALPPLQTMECLLFRMIGLGFALLTVGLLSGALFVDNLFAQKLVHKSVLTIAAWLIFAGLLFGHWRYGWRGRTAIRWTLSGFVLLLVGFVGSKLILEWVLR